MDCHGWASMRTSSRARPTLSPAVPWTLTRPVMPAPLVGVVIATVGGVVSAVLLATVTDRVAVPVLPLLSVARLTRVCVPLARPVVGHVHVQEVVPDAACQAPPSTATSTRATATSSAPDPETVT